MIVRLDSLNSRVRSNSLESSIDRVLIELSLNQVSILLILYIYFMGKDIIWTLERWHVIINTSSVFLDVTLSILGSFKLDVTFLFWVIISLYLSPITCSHETILFFVHSISLLSKNYLGVRDLKSVTSNKKRRKYISCPDMIISSVHNCNIPYWHIF